MTPEEQKEQVAEFSVWGISERMRRNALTTSFVLVISWAVYTDHRGNNREAALKAEIIVLQKIILENKDKTAVEVDAIRREHLTFLLKLLEEQKKNSESIKQIIKKTNK